MRALPFALLAACVVPAVSFAQVELEIELPKVRFEVAPALVTISPGIEVVPGRADEVFFVSGAYWVRHGKHWFRARGHRASWVAVPTAKVPAALVKLPPGKYRHLKASKHAPKQGGGKGKHKGHGKGNGRGKK